MGERGGHVSETWSEARKEERSKIGGEHRLPTKRDAERANVSLSRTKWAETDRIALARYKSILEFISFVSVAHTMITWHAHASFTETFPPQTANVSDGVAVEAVATSMAS